MIREGISNSSNNLLITFISLIASFLLLFGCSNSNQPKIYSICESANSPCLQGKAIVILKTNIGEITLELDGDSSPITAGNFLDLVSKGVYNNTVFHRVIKEPIPFVIQGGDPLSKDPSTPKNEFGTGSFIDPLTGRARFIPLEIKLTGERMPRYNQLITNPNEISQLRLNHKRGSIAMARSQKMDSGSAQFYIALKLLPELDGRYSVFGRVIDGIEIVEKLEYGDKIMKAIINQ